MSIALLLVETEEGETGGGTDCIRPSRNGGKDIVEQLLAGVGKTDKEEGNAEEEPKEGMDPDCGLKTE